MPGKPARRSQRRVHSNLNKSIVLDKLQRPVALVDLSTIWQKIAPNFPQEFQISLARPDDLLVCNFIFHNLTLAGNDGSPKLVRKNLDELATLIVELPPQCFGEQAFREEPTKDTVGSLPSAKIRMSGQSRIAFVMPDNEQELDFTLEAVLTACRRWPLSLEPNALPDPDPSPLEKFKQSGVSIKNLLQTLSASRVQALSTLLRATSISASTQQAFDLAAQRIVKQTIDAIRKGPARKAAALVQELLKREVDRVAETYAPLRDSARRDAALATLSLITTESFVRTAGYEFALEQVRDFGFLSPQLVPHQPSPLVTALELPYRLVLSPIPEANWWHATAPVVRNGRTELWHTILTNRSDGIGRPLPTKVRALWSPDYPLDPTKIKAGSEPNAKPFRMSLDASDRYYLVEQTADFEQGAFVPRAVVSKRLQLSALGGLLDVEGHWDGDVVLDQWRHISTLGRDHYVKIARRGFLCSFGHAAVFVKVTERKFESLQAGGPRVAVLRQRSYIRVRERIKHYDGTGHQFHGYNFPFTSVEILTEETPNLIEPGPSNSLPDPTIYSPPSVQPSDCFWPLIGERVPFVFQVAATDLMGNRITFGVPLLFVGKEANKRSAVMQAILNQYNNNADFVVRRTASFSNASVSYAPPAPDGITDARLPTSTVTFAAGNVSGISTQKAQFYPEVASANVGIAAIQRLLQKPDAMVDVEYPDIYKNGGFSGGNSGEVFLKTRNALPLAFGGAVKSDSLGGLATPSMDILGLSRIVGPVAGQTPANPDDIESALSQVIGNTFNPTDFFKDAKILGGVDLAKILEIVPLAGDNVPKLLSSQDHGMIEARFDWNTQINKSDDNGIFVPNAGGATILDMHGVVSSPVAPATGTTFSATASLVNFKVNLFGFVTIWFDRLQFISKSGAKPDVAVDLHPGDETITFGGPLEFVNELRKIIPSNGFSDPPSISVTPSGLSAGYSISLPSLAVGIFALEHVSLGAGFVLPFDGKPAEVHFNFAERQRPFSLTVSLLGGGGFFAIGVGTDGVREIEAALEFGAALSINLGVASGSVEVKAGIYFHWLQTSVELAGYVRLHGELSVLGLISASLTFNLQLAYLKDSGHSVVWGEATVEVEIDVLMLSFSVSVKCRREFGGSAADPKFIDLIPNQSIWTSYCHAFALEGV